MSLHTNQASTSPPPQQDTSKTPDYNVDFNSTFVMEPLPTLTPGSLFSTNQDTIELFRSASKTLRITAQSIYPITVKIYTAMGLVSMHPLATVAVLLHQLQLILCFPHHQRIHKAHTGRWKMVRSRRATRLGTKLSP